MTAPRTTLWLPRNAGVSGKRASGRAVDCDAPALGVHEQGRRGIMHTLIGLGLSLAIAIPSMGFAETTASRVFAKASPSIVVMDAVDGTGKVIALGSGVVIAKDVVVSNCHVFENKSTDTASVVYEHKRFAATLRYADLGHDLCSFTVQDLAAPPITMGATSGLVVGENAYAIGAPEGFDLTLSSGIISSLREIPGGTIIQMTTPISPGSSGGGLFDSDGRLIGITSYYEKGSQQINFALPVEWIGALPKRGETLQQLATEARNTAQGNHQESNKAYNSGGPATRHKTLTSLAERGNSHAQLALARMYCNGVGVVQDCAKGMRWAITAAEHGDADAQGFVGTSYQLGEGVPQSYSKALQWYSKAAKQGDSFGQLSLGLAYAEAQGVTRDYAKAAYWLGKAADHTGALAAQYSLGAMYYNGQGVPQDVVQALKWLFVARAGGLELSGEALRFDLGSGRDEHPAETVSLVESKMTPSQIAAAQTLANNWWATYHEQSAGQNPTTDVSPAAAPPRRPADPHDVQGWHQFLTSVVQNNLGDIANSPFVYFVPSAVDPADATALAQVQADLNDVVAATVLPENMVAIGGPSSRTTAMVLETAFRRAAPNSFKGVVILFIGNEADRVAVARTIRSSGATFRFAQM